MAGFIAGIINRNPGAAPLIIEPRNPGNHRPQFQAEFGVAKEEPDGPWVGPLKRLGNHALRPRPATFTLRLLIPLPLKYPTRVWFLGGGVLLSAEGMIANILLTDHQVPGGTE